MKIRIPDFANSRVLVCGDLMLDRYWHGDTSRISPEAPVPVVRVVQAEERPGGAANVAVNIASLGGHATLVGLTGDDEPANMLDSVMKRAGVTCDFERLNGSATITKLRVMSRHQQLIRLDFENGFGEPEQPGLLRRFEAALGGADIVVLSDYGKGTLSAVQQLIASARSARKPVVIDPKGTDFGRYRGATVITPNMSEFEAVAGKCHSDEELAAKGEALREQLELEALLITRSENGMTLLYRGRPALHLPTKAREVYDVTGAGDTVVSVLAAGMAAGLDMADATALANLAAGVVVGKMGTVSVTVPELHRALREYDEMEQGIIGEDELIALVREAQAHGEKVVMTNGCFDILHAGHVTYLQQAAELGDRLIVAVNDDASVKRLKGEERPVNTLERRMHVLAALGCVDWVVPFYEDTPTRLICAIKPNILVKGVGNEPAKIPGGDCVRAAGGQVMVMDYVEGVSPTALISVIRPRS